MKKYIIYAMSLFLAGTAFTACTNEEDDIFEASPADRLNQAIEDYTDILCAVPNGWVMQYFTNEREPGYIYLMKFDKNTSVKIAGNNKWIGNTYKEETSMFEIITDNGPVLTFNTFNDVFHVFSDPDDVPDTEVDNEQGYGHKGDYEFIVMEAKSDYIRLKGKKYSKIIEMRPLEEGKDWETYMTECAEFINTTLSSKLPVYQLHTAKGIYNLAHADYGYFYACKTDGDPVTETDFIPFIKDGDGIKFWESYKGSDEAISVQHFQLNEDGILACTDEGYTDAFICAPNAAELVASAFPVMTLTVDKDAKLERPVLSSTSSSWRFDNSSFTGGLIQLFDDMNTSIGQYRSGQSIRTIDWSYNGSTDRLAMQFRTAKYNFTLYFSTVIEDGKFTLTYLEGDSNGEVWYRNCEGIRNFAAKLCSAQIAAETDNALNVTKTTLKLSDSESFVLNIR